MRYQKYHTSGDGPRKAVTKFEKNHEYFKIRIFSTSQVQFFLTNENFLPHFVIFGET